MHMRSRYLPSTTAFERNALPLLSISPSKRLIQPIDQRLRLRRCRQRSKCGGHISEGADAEIAGDRFEIGMRAEEPECVFRQRHVVRNRLPKSGAPRLLKRHPDLQRPEAARILRPEIEVIDRVRIEVVVGRAVRKRIQQQLRIPAPECSPPQPARRATYEDPRQPNRPALDPADPPVHRERTPRARRTRRRRGTRGPVRGRTRPVPAADRSRPCSLCPAVPTTRKGWSPRCKVLLHLLSEAPIHPCPGNRRRRSIAPNPCPGRPYPLPSESRCAFPANSNSAGACSPGLLPSEVPGRRRPREPRESPRNSPCCRRSPAARRNPAGSR